MQPDPPQDSLCSGMYTHHYVNGTSTVCDQKVLVFVLQIEKSKQSTWVG
jgi:hypothetical protein